MAKAEFEFVKTTELGTIDGGVDVVLGHYKQGDKEYGDKVYLFETYSKKDGTEITKSVGKFSLKQLEDLQKIDISNFDTSVSNAEMFD